MRSGGLTSIALLLLAAGASAQGPQHVVWTIEPPPTAPPGGKVLARINGNVEAGWHLYSASSPAGIPTSFKVGPASMVELVRVLQPKPKKSFDANFNSDTETFEGPVAFLVELALAKDAPAGPAELAVSIRYQTCNATTCVPGRWTGTAKLNVEPGAAAAAPAIPA